MKVLFTAVGGALLGLLWSLVVIRFVAPAASFGASVAITIVGALGLGLLFGQYHRQAYRVLLLFWQFLCALGKGLLGAIGRGGVRYFAILGMFLALGCGDARDQARPSVREPIQRWTPVRVEKYKMLDGASVYRIVDKDQFGNTRTCYMFSLGGIHCP